MHFDINDLKAPNAACDPGKRPLIHAEAMAKEREKIRHEAEEERWAKGLVDPCKCPPFEKPDPQHQYDNETLSIASRKRWGEGSDLTFTPDEIRFEPTDY